MTTAFFVRCELLESKLRDCKEELSSLQTQCNERSLEVDETKSQLQESKRGRSEERRKREKR